MSGGAIAWSRASIAEADTVSISMYTPSCARSNGAAQEFNHELKLPAHEKSAQIQHLITPE